MEVKCETKKDMYIEFGKFLNKLAKELLKRIVVNFYNKLDTSIIHESQINSIVYNFRINKGYQMVKYLRYIQMPNKVQMGKLALLFIIFLV
jgi:hypothetical protein